MKSKGCQVNYLAYGLNCTIGHCNCGQVHVTIGKTTHHLTVNEFRDLLHTSALARKNLPG